MKIESQNTYTPNFGAIYRIKHTNTASRELIKNKLMNLKEKAILVDGESPLSNAINNILQLHARKIGLSEDWLKGNIEHFGGKVPRPENTNSWVITGEKDCQGTLDFLSKNRFIPVKIFLKKILTTLFPPSEEKVPTHLRSIYPFVDEYKKVNVKFEKQMKKIDEIIECKDSDDFLKKISKK